MLDGGRMTERGGSHGRRDSHDEIPYCTRRAQKLRIAASSNGPRNKFLDARDARNVPAAVWDESVTTRLFFESITERNLGCGHRVTVHSKKECARPTTPTSCLVPEMLSTFPSFCRWTAQCGLHHELRSIRSVYEIEGRSARKSCARSFRWQVASC